MTTIKCEKNNQCMYMMPYKDCYIIRCFVSQM